MKHNRQLFDQLRRHENMRDALRARRVQTSNAADLALIDSGLAYEEARIENCMDRLVHNLGGK